MSSQFSFLLKYHPKFIKYIIYAMLLLKENKNVGRGAEEMAQRAKHLSCMCEDMSSDPRTHTNA